MALIVLAVAPGARAADPSVAPDPTDTTTANPPIPAAKARLVELTVGAHAGTLSPAEAVELANLRAWSIGTTATPAMIKTAMDAATLTSNYLVQTQTAQSRQNWCGPASAWSVVDAWHLENGWSLNSALDGQGLTQSALSGSNYTNAGLNGGTDWGHGDMERALNNWLGLTGSMYVRTTPSSIANLSAMVMTDIDSQWMVAAGTAEPANWDHYNSHPKPYDVWHWITARGYASSGATLALQDPATSLGWPGVAAYFSLTATNLYHFAKTNGRTYGIVW